MKKSLIILNTIALIFLTSCAASLNKHYQKVELKSQRGVTILVDGKKPKKEKGAYYLKRDLKAKQITVSKKGYLPYNKVVMQTKTSPLKFFSYIPFGIFYYPVHFDKAGRTYNYEKSYFIKQKMILEPKRDSLSKQFKVNKVGFDINGKDFKIDIQYYNDYLKKKKRSLFSESAKDYDLVIENSRFTKILNDILHKGGFTDSTAVAIQRSYHTHALLNANITEMKIKMVRGNFSGYSLDYDSDKEGSANPFHISFPKMFVVEMKTEWAIVDPYNKTLYSLKTRTKSDELAFDSEIKEEGKNTLLKATENALVKSLSIFINKKQTKDLLKLEKAEDFIESEKLILDQGDRVVSNLEETVASSVTIVVDEGHGSGFFVSNNGYIVTNYHVVTDKEEVKVILNNEKEYLAKVIRSNKLQDLALIKIDLDQTIPVKFAPKESQKLATTVYAVGTPFAESFNQTISKGIISAFRKVDDEVSLIQSDASINGGNSGGAMVNKNGECIGVVSSKIIGVGVEGVSFAIPGHIVRKALNLEFL